MDFMAVLFILLFLGYVGVNVWDHWEERRKLFTDDGRFLRHQFLRGMIMAPAEPTELSPDAKFAIQHTSTALRCEVCHHGDHFDVKTGHCQRCNHRTL